MAFLTVEQIALHTLWGMGEKEYVQCLRIRKSFTRCLPYEMLPWPGVLTAGLLIKFLQELKNFLRSGKTLNELWLVAKGEIKYKDFLASNERAPSGVALAPTPAPVKVPEELVRSPSQSC